MKVRTNVRAGGLQPQHNRKALKVRTSVGSGGIDGNNHNRRTLKIAR